ncbi:MAG TPA: hypothetical protein VLB69_11560 [Rudaea sp.]|nr:hypothetical protein [Rudaea sp.]
MSNKSIKPIAVALGAAFVGSLSLGQVAQASSTFQMSSLIAPYAMAGTDAKATEGKCGMEKCDSNKDGKATKEEAMAAGWTEAQFNMADTKHQGFLTQASFDAYHLLNKSEGGAKKGKEGSCSADKKGKEGSCSGH